MMESPQLRIKLQFWTMENRRWTMENRHWTKKANIENSFLKTKIEQRGKYFDIFHAWFKGVRQ